MISKTKTNETKLHARNFALAILILLPLFTLAIGAFATSTLSSAISFSLSSTLTQTDLSTTRDVIAYSAQKSLGIGSGTTALADVIYSANITLTDTGTSALDLYGTLADKFGNTVNMARAKIVYIENTSGSMTVTIGSTTAGINLPLFGTDDTLAIKPYGIMAIVNPLAGVTVTDATADTIWIENSAGDTATIKVFIVGSSQ